MKQYRVIAGACPSVRGKSHQYGAIITAADVDNADERLRNRFIEEVASEPEATEPEPETTDEPQQTGEPATPEEASSETPEPKPANTELAKELNKKNKPELMQLLQDKGIDFPAGANKDVLIDLLTK